MRRMGILVMVTALSLGGVVSVAAEEKQKPGIILQQKKPIEHVDACECICRAGDVTEDIIFKGRTCRAGEIGESCTLTDGTKGSKTFCSTTSVPKGTTRVLVPIEVLEELLAR